MSIPMYEEPFASSHTTLHAAVCDDNAADRKQLERLLKREADKRLAAGDVLYVDSYGHPDTLLQNPLQYDVFFVDIAHTPGADAVNIVNRLTAAGSSSPVVFCSSSIDYRALPLPSHVLFLDKPIKAAELSQCLDQAGENKKAAVPLIELREESGHTCYVTEPDILYAITQGRGLKVALKDGRTLMLATTAANFFDQVENYPVFFAPSRHSVLNGRYIQSIRLGRITMPDGTAFRAFGYILRYAENIHKQYPQGE